MYSKAMKILHRFHNNFILVFSRIIIFLRGSAISLKDKIKIKNKYSNQDQLENKVRDMAEVLVNMIVIGKEKRNLCTYYDAISGLCKYAKIYVEIPTLKTVEEEGVHRIVVSVHPEVCAVCPFWVKKLT